MKSFIKTWLPITAFVLFFVLLIISRPHLHDLSSKYQQNQLSPTQKTVVTDSINRLYNYAENGGEYTYTFLEFGSLGCGECKKMEAVMEDIKAQYPGKVNVVFVNVVEKEQKEIVRYYGIATIPTQVLLDRSGKEYFRHIGFIDRAELQKHFN